MSPLYDFRCEEGHVTEVRAGRELEALLCPTCGRTAPRVPIYKNQYIIGETVAKSCPKATRLGNVVDKHGRYRVDLFQEGMAEMNHACDKAGVEPPLVWEEAKRRARKVNGGRVMNEPPKIRQAT